MRRAKLRLQFGIPFLLVVTGIVAISTALLTYPHRRIAHTRATYDAQKQVVDSTVAKFIRLLQQRGFQVSNETVRFGGSGEWRSLVMLVAHGSSSHEKCCVEVEGFVSHDDQDRPDWMNILPLKIRPRGNSLDSRFVQLLTDALEQNEWKFDIQGTRDEKSNGSGSVGRDQRCRIPKWRFR